MRGPKRQATDYREVYAKYVSDSFDPEYIKISQNPIIMKQTTEKNKGKVLSPQRYIDVNKPKGCSTSLVIVEMQIKITMRCHYTHIRFAKIMKTDLILNVGKNVRDTG